MQPTQLLLVLCAALLIALPLTSAADVLESGIWTKYVQVGSGSTAGPDSSSLSLRRYWRSCKPTGHVTLHSVRTLRDGVRYRVSLLVTKPVGTTCKPNDPTSTSFKTVEVLEWGDPEFGQARIDPAGLQLFTVDKGATARLNGVAIVNTTVCIYTDPGSFIGRFKTGGRTCVSSGVRIVFHDVNVACRNVIGNNRTSQSTVDEFSYFTANEYSTCFAGTNGSASVYVGAEAFAVTNESTSFDGNSYAQYRRAPATSGRRRALVSAAAAAAPLHPHRGGDASPSGILARGARDAAAVVPARRGLREVRQIITRNYDGPFTVEISRGSGYLLLNLVTVENMEEYSSAYPKFSAPGAPPLKSWYVEARAPGSNDQRNLRTTFWVPLSQMEAANFTLPRSLPSLEPAVLRGRLVTTNACFWNEGTRTCNVTASVELNFAVACRPVAARAQKLTWSYKAFWDTYLAPTARVTQDEKDYSCTFGATNVTARVTSGATAYTVTGVLSWLHKRQLFDLRYFPHWLG